MGSTPRYSIIIPVYNEFRRLPRTLFHLERYLKSNQRQLSEYEIIFVDDGSTDKTLSLLKKSTLPLTIIQQDQNYGKGWAVRKGMLEAHGHYRAFIDADLATPFSELDRLFKALGQSDVAIGSRITADGVDLRRQGQQPQSIIRRILGQAFRLLATKPFLGDIKDSQCGAKAFTADAAKLLFSQQKIKRWSFDIEILYLAKRNHLTISEIPVEWSAQQDSKLTPSITLAFTILKELATIIWIHR